MPRAVSATAGASGVSTSLGASAWPSSSRPRTTLTVCDLPLRQTTTRTSLPTSVSATIRGRSFISFTSWPSNLRITSPASTPPDSAGPPEVTSDTSAPFASSSSSPSAISSVTVWMRTPSQPRRVRPNSRSCPTTFFTRAEGTEKAMPAEPPDGEMIAVFTPITSPSMLKSGPPELPLLIAASV